MVRLQYFVFQYEKVTYEMDVSKMSSKGNIEQQTPLDQDLISIAAGFVLGNNFSFRKWAVFQLSNFANRRFKQ